MTAMKHYQQQIACRRLATNQFQIFKRFLPGSSRNSLRCGAEFIFTEIHQSDAAAFLRKPERSACFTPISPRADRPYSGPVQDFKCFDYIGRPLIPQMIVGEKRHREETFKQTNRGRRAVQLGAGLDDRRQFGCQRGFPLHGTEIAPFQKCFQLSENLSGSPPGNDSGSRFPRADVAADCYFESIVSLRISQYNAQGNIFASRELNRKAANAGTIIFFFSN